ncbi:hypothetical protein [Actinacidiphila rubida]|nr:hypothetical protein [Actinacidiphila rubida]
MSGRNLSRSNRPGWRHADAMNAVAGQIDVTAVVQMRRRTY